jgi:hypothetical protein
MLATLHHCHELEGVIHNVIEYVDEQFPHRHHHRPKQIKESYDEIRHINRESSKSNTTALHHGNTADTTRRDNRLEPARSEFLPCLPMPIPILPYMPLI